MTLVVVLHYECSVTKQMQKDRLASMVKKWRLRIKIETGKKLEILVYEKILLIAKIRKIIINRHFFMNSSSKRREGGSLSSLTFLLPL